METIEALAAVWMAIIGFWWGEWYAESKAKRNSWKNDVGLILITKMATQLVDSQKFAPDCKLTASHKLNHKEHEFTLSMALEPQKTD